MVQPNNQKMAMLDGGKQTMYLDLKQPSANEIFCKLIQKQNIDVLIDPFRPGVLERLNLGPKQLSSINEGLIYARLSGYGQNGPLALKAGHDINYISLAGVLSRFGVKGQPPVGPANILGDFGGGGLMCAMGIVMALFERTKSKKGQVVDCSITEGSAYLSSFLWETINKQSDFFWPNKKHKQSNLLDFGAPFYRCYSTSDGKYMAVGALEEKFYQILMSAIDLNVEDYDRFEVDQWPRIIEEIQNKFSQKSQQEWIEVFDELDCCVTPVLTLEEAPQFHQNKERQAFGDDRLPSPAPKLSRTPGERLPSNAQSVTRQILKDLGYSHERIDQFAQEMIID